MRTSFRLLLAMALVAGSSGCAGAQTKVGAVMFFGGLAGLAGGVGATVGGCSPSPEFCRSMTPARVDVGVPLIAASTLALLAGGALVLSAKGDHPEPTPPSRAPKPASLAPRRAPLRSDWVSPL